MRQRSTWLEELDNIILLVITIKDQAYRKVCEFLGSKLLWLWQLSKIRQTSCEVITFVFPICIYKRNISITLIIQTIINYKTIFEIGDQCFNNAWLYNTSIKTHSLYLNVSNTMITTTRKSWNYYLNSMRHLWKWNVCCSIWCSWLTCLDRCSHLQTKTKQKQKTLRGKCEIKSQSSININI